MARRRLGWTALAAAGLAPLLGACHGADRQSLVAKAPQRTAAPGTARLIITVVEGEQTYTFDGRVDFVHHRTAVVASLPGLGQFEDGFDGATVYLHLLDHVPI